MSAGGPRSRLVAVLLSALACPGAGQIYKRQYARGSLLIFISLAVVAAVFVKTWTAMMDIALVTPPERLMVDALGVARGIMEKEKVFFTASGYSFLAVWLYGVIDAAFTRARPGGRDGVA